ncbi:MAG: hypothetical protein M3Q95_03495 [Bacteroidota bacterium]|nr:hypothetical protein [Bacteroidota bacterium]
MKKFSIRFLQITLVIFLMSLVLHLVFYPSLSVTPWTWGSDLLQFKRQQVVESQEKFNCLIIGSSRVYRQVNPALLDSLIDSPLNTYNMGVNWLFAPESFYVMDQLVSTDSVPLKCVIIELSKIRSIDYSNLHTARTKYWYNFSNFVFTLRAVASSNFAFHERIATILAHTVSYVDQLINLGYLTEAFHFRTATKNSIETPEEIGNNGYLPLSVSNAVTVEENVNDRHRKFLQDTSVVTRRYTTSVNQFRKFEENPDLLNRYNRVYAEALNDRISQAKLKGIHLVFLLTPRIDHNQYNELIPLFNTIHPEHRIEISDGRKYPQLYFAGYSFDETHLNTAGADLFTTLLAEKLKPILNKSN